MVDEVVEDGRPLKVLIAGGGIGGLSAAIALRQAGHIVEVRITSLYIPSFLTQV